MTGAEKKQRLDEIKELMLAFCDQHFGEDFEVQLLMNLEWNYC